MSSNLTAVSLFAGILTGGFDEALSRAGVHVAASVEIDPACRGVLRRHFPQAKIFNDVTEVSGEQLRAAGFVPGRGILCFGWPCQGNSVAGRGKGMADPRSGLWRHVVRLVAETRPRWLLGENVPGLLSVNGGRDFGTVIRDLDELGYGVAWRVLDAQFFGVPQRRRRVFIAGCLGDPCGPVEVLLEPEGGEGNPAEGAATRAGTAGTPSGGTDGLRTVGTLGTTGPGGGWRLGADEAAAGQLIASTLQGCGRRGHRVDAEGAAGGHLIAFDAAQITSGENRVNPKPGDPSPPLVATGQPMVAGTLRSHPRPGSNSSGAIAAPMAFNPQTGGSKAMLGYGDKPTALQANQVTGVQTETAVRRLTPVECERLQGFPAITKALRIEVWNCSGHPKSLALAGSQNPKSQKSAPDADVPGSSNPAQPADSHSKCSRPGPALPVVASVHIDCEANAAEIRSPDGRNWSVNGAALKKSSPLAMLFDVSARLFAPMPPTQGQETSTGRAGSPPSPAPFTPQPSGAICVPVCGLEIGGAVGAAHKSGFGEASRSTSITPQAGRATRHSGSTWTTLCCSALHAIGSFIPLPTPGTTSYAVELTASAGWTRWLDDGTEQSDSARYRECGNAIAVPVAGWIARRVVAAELAVEAESAA